MPPGRPVRETGRKYMVCFSERLQSESAVYAGELIRQGAIGRVIQVLGMGPHRAERPVASGLVFERARYGGILCDIGSHQIEQFLFYTGATDATVAASKIANYNHPEYPELDDFGDATLIGNNGATGYFRVDWFTPDGLRSWGTAGPSSSAPMGISSCARISMSAAGGTGTMSSGSTGRGNIHLTPAARPVSRFSDNWCSTA